MRRNRVVAANPLSELATGVERADHSRGSGIDIIDPRDRERHLAHLLDRHQPSALIAAYGQVDQPASGGRGELIVLV